MENYQIFFGISLFLFAVSLHVFFGISNHIKEARELSPEVSKYLTPSKFSYFLPAIFFLAGVAFLYFAAVRYGIVGEDKVMSNVSSHSVTGVRENERAKNADFR